VRLHTRGLDNIVFDRRASGWQSSNSSGAKRGYMYPGRDMLTSAPLLQAIGWIEMAQSFGVSDRGEVG